eukprot:scaffold130249_cov23-Tisochrysis_lutea.AAC.1
MAMAAGLLWHLVHRAASQDELHRPSPRQTGDDAAVLRGVLLVRQEKRDERRGFLSPVISPLERASERRIREKQVKGGLRDDECFEQKRQINECGAGKGGNEGERGRGPMKFVPVPDLRGTSVE